jgi:hypothetical protein
MSPTPNARKEMAKACQTAKFDEMNARHLALAAGDWYG